jgi:hypothetical protein
MQQLAAAADGAAAGLKALADFKKSVDDKFKPASDFLNDVNQKVHDFGAMIRGEASDHFQGNSGPHGVVGPRGPGGATMGSIAAPNVSINTPVTAPLSGKAEVSVTINTDGILGQIKKIVQGEISGAFSGLMNGLKSAPANSPAGHDGRANPITPDGSTLGP